MKTDKTRVFNMDCMEYMKDIPDKHFELAIVDPPYGIDWMNQTKSVNLNKNWKQYTAKDWDKIPPSIYYFKELFRISKNQVIWGANYFEGMPATPCWVIWDKMQEFSGATFEMAWTSFKSPCKSFKMARCQAYVGINKIHPTQKPIKLYEWILMNYANEGDKILDTHLGSGSSRIASYNLGYDFTGIELDKEYFDASVKRFDNHKKQLTLF